jgi:hypothetical protein
MKNDRCCVTSHCPKSVGDVTAASMLFSHASDMAYAGRVDSVTTALAPTVKRPLASPVMVRTL